MTCTQLTVVVFKAGPDPLISEGRYRGVLVLMIAKHMHQSWSSMDPVPATPFNLDGLANTTRRP